MVSIVFYEISMWNSSGTIVIVTRSGTVAVVTHSGTVCLGIRSGTTASIIHSGTIARVTHSGTTAIVTHSGTTYANLQYLMVFTMYQLPVTKAIPVMCKRLRYLMVHEAKVIQKNCKSHSKREWNLRRLQP